MPTGINYLLQPPLKHAAFDSEVPGEEKADNSLLTSQDLQLGHSVCCSEALRCNFSNREPHREHTYSKIGIDDPPHKVNML